MRIASFLISTLFLLIFIACGSDKPDASQQDVVTPEEKKEIIKLDSLSQQLDDASSEIDAKAQELEDALKDIEEQ